MKVFAIISATLAALWAIGWGIISLIAKPKQEREAFAICVVFSITGLLWFITAICLSCV